MKLKTTSKSDVRGLRKESERSGEERKNFPREERKNFSKSEERQDI